jgi:hypothetical protein
MVVPVTPSAEQVSSGASSEALGKKKVAVFTAANFI